MAGSTDVVVKFLADVSNIQDGVKKIESTTGRVTKWAGRVGKALAGAFVVKEVGDFIAAAEEANVANQRLEQTLRNAGDASGQWAKHAENLADTLQRQTGIDDEVIKGGQAILSTFHAVGGEVGQNSGAFDRATKAALDLSKTGFGDVDSAAKALGKALQDPEKGITALKKSGVDFTDEQKNLIKSMVESGDQAGAMNEILKVVEGQVGGVAEKTATAGDKMKVAWSETKEQLGNALLPVLQQLMPMVATLATFVQQNATWLVPMAIATAIVVIALKAWITAQTALNVLLAAFGVELSVPVALIFGIALAILAAYVAVALLYAKWDQVWTFIGNLSAYAKTAIAIFAITNPVTLLIGIVTTLAVYWSTIWERITSVIGAASNFVAAQTRAIADVIAAMVNAITQTLSAVAGFVDTFLVAPFQAAVGLVGDAVDAIKTLWNNTVGGFGFEVPGWVPGIGGKGWKIPEMAAGGIVTRPTLAMIGERGPEAVIPLSRGANTGIGNVTINITTTGLGADAPAIQSAVVAALRQYTTRNGPLPATITG